MTFLEIIITSILSLAIGLFMGIIGGGGGGIYLIIIMIFFHQNVQNSIGMSLILSTITLSGAALQYFIKKQIKIDYFITISLFGIIGVLIGSLLIKFISENIIKVAIISVFVLSGLSSLLKIKSNCNNDRVAKAAKKMHLLIPLGLFSGFITGSLGLSGATPLSSLLIGLLNFSPYFAVGTTTLIALVLNLTGAIFHASNTNMNMQILVILGIGSAIGAVFGAKLASKINRKILTIVLAVMAISSGVYLAVH